MRFRDVLALEFERRRRLNPRYSLRAFARALGVSHTTLSRNLRQGRPLAARRVVALGHRLRLPAADLEAYSVRETEEGVLAAIDRPSFRPDSRWLATIVGVSVDEINVTLHALLHRRRLAMTSSRRWTRLGEETAPP